MSRPWQWNDETLWSATLSATGGEMRVDVVSEVPVTKEGDRLPRYGNRYYPTMVRLGTGYRRDGEELTTLLVVEDARAIGQALIHAADLADETDAPDTDPCGHWHPCSCSKPA